MKTKKITQNELLYELKKHFVLIENMNSSLGSVLGIVILSIIISLISLLLVIFK